MAKQIPPNFEKHWEGANIILRTLKSKGRKLYANKAELAENSSYFNAMFFSGFKEAYQDSVDVPCSYRCMLSILKTIHKSNKSREPKSPSLWGPSPQRLGVTGHLLGVSTVEDLVEMYRVADMFDLPNITNMYSDNKINAEISAITAAALKLGNRDMLMNCLKNMDKIRLRKFIGKNDNAPMFCKKDVVLIFEKISGITLPKDLYIPEANILPKLETSSQKMNVTMKVNSRNLAISTKNSKGSLLYTKKEILAANSKNFCQMFENKRFSSISLDVDYMTMRAVLCVLHKLTFSPSATFHPLLLFDMYRFAIQFDMEIIKNFVSDRFVKQTTVECLDVALKLNVPQWKTLIIAKMLPNELRHWVQSEDEELVYHNGHGGKLLISSKTTDLNLSLNDVRSIVLKLQSEFVKIIPDVAQNGTNRGSSAVVRGTSGAVRGGRGTSRGAFATVRGDHARRAAAVPGSLSGTRRGAPAITDRSSERGGRGNAELVRGGRGGASVVARRGRGTPQAAHGGLGMNHDDIPPIRPSNHYRTCTLL